MKCVRRRPFLLIGWLWYLGMLLSVIGILPQVGDQDMANRYVYLPMVGLSIAAIWVAGDAIAQRPLMRRGAAVFSVLWLAALSVVASRQTKYWADTARSLNTGSQ